MKKTVLIADDESSIRKLYERELSKEGYNVVTASTATELAPGFIKPDQERGGSSGERWKVTNRNRTSGILGRYTGRR